MIFKKETPALRGVQVVTVTQGCAGKQPTATSMGKMDLICPFPWGKDSHDNRFKLPTGSHCRGRDIHVCSWELVWAGSSWLQHTPEVTSRPRSEKLFGYKGWIGVWGKPEAESRTGFYRAAPSDTAVTRHMWLFDLNLN